MKTLKQIAKGKGEKAEQAKEMIELNKQKKWINVELKGKEKDDYIAKHFPKKEKSIYDNIKDPAKEKHICSLCKTEYIGFGNNAEPINSGRCCDICNTFVIIARLNIMRNWEEKK